jgi:hypothetical protein
MDFDLFIENFDLAYINILSNILDNIFMQLSHFMNMVFGLNALECGLQK